MSTTAARIFFGKNNWRKKQLEGRWKKGKLSSKQQSTTQIGCVNQGEGAWGSRRMAMVVRGMGAEGKGDW